MQQKVSRVCWFRLWGVELTSDLIASAESKSGRWAATTTTLQLLDTLRRRYIASCLELQGRLKVRQAIYWGMRPKLSLHVYILVLFAKGGGTLRAIIRWDLESRCHIHQVVRSHVHLSWLYTDQKEGGGWLGGSSVPEEYVCLRDFVHNRMHERTWDGSIKQHTLEDIGVSSIQGTPAPAAPLEDAIRRLSTEIIFRCLYNSNEAHWDPFYLLCYFHIHFQLLTYIPDVRISISALIEMRWFD